MKSISLFPLLFLSVIPNPSPWDDLIIDFPKPDCTCCLKTPSCPLKITIADTLLYPDLISLNRIMNLPKKPERIPNHHSKTRITFKAKEGATKVVLRSTNKRFVLSKTRLDLGKDGEETVEIEYKGSDGLENGHVNGTKTIYGLSPGLLEVEMVGAKGTLRNSITLAGIWQDSAQDFIFYSEPCITQVARVLGITTTFNKNNNCYTPSLEIKGKDVIVESSGFEPYNGFGARIPSSEDELMGDFMLKIDQKQPVRYQLIADFRNCCINSITTSWFLRKDGKYKRLFTSEVKDSQGIFPKSIAGGTEFFDPPDNQMFSIGFIGTSGDSKKNVRDVRCLTKEGCGRYFRYWRVRERYTNKIFEGKIIVGVEYAPLKDGTFAGNCDYNDAIYMISNARVVDGSYSGTSKATKGSSRRPRRSERSDLDL